MLLAGGLIQDYAAQCQSRGQEFRIVVDDAFRDLLEGTLPAHCFIWYPRAAIKRAGSAWTKLSLYWGALSQMRKFSADLAFNIEEDSTTHHLTRLSGAAFKLGCSTARHKRGYDHVLPIDYHSRPEQRWHRWYSFQEVFAALGLPESEPGYLRFPNAAMTQALRAKLQSLGLELSGRFVVIHPGAAKDYKQWPLQYFAKVVEQLLLRGNQVVLIGAGVDAANAQAIVKLLPADAPVDGVINATNQLTLAELVQLFRHAHAVVGNDSGPFHLAAAAGATGVVIFGPTDVRLWAPLSAKTVVMKSREACSPECTKTGCIHQQRCLWATTPEAVLARLPGYGPAAAPTALHIS